MSDLYRTKGRPHDSTPSASIHHIEAYIELLYSDKTEDKIKSAQSILFLLNEAESIEVILNHESLVGILARTLRDEFKKSIKLGLYLAGIFYVISNFSTLHPALLQVSLS
jgi:hypothetical protein